MSLSATSHRPCIAIIAAGAMGAAMGARLASSGCRVLTDLTHRSASTRKRAEQAGMEDTSLAQIASMADFVLSVLPPSDALQLAHDFRSQISPGDNRSFIYADCNAVSPTTVKKIQDIFDETQVRFLDAGIIGGPPRENYNPTIYASADDPSVLSEFEELNKLGLKVVALRGEGAGIGDASALKMSYAVRFHLPTLDTGRV
jgi:3-hydroxyisobutyrate dehydrogenase-like beta-hydroxyacid dehydrogenase